MINHTQEADIMRSFCKRKLHLYGANQHQQHTSFKCKMLVHVRCSADKFGQNKQSNDTNSIIINEGPSVRIETPAPY